MGVPKQVAEMEAEGDKEIAEQEATQVATSEKNPAAMPEPKKTEEATPPPAPTAGKANLLANVGNDDAAREEAHKAQREASAEGRLRKLQGQLSEQRESYEAKVTELEARIRELDDKLKNVQIGGAPSRDDATDEEIFAEIRKEYSAEDYSDEDLKRFIGVINRVGSRSLRAIQKRFDEMDAEKADRAKRAAKAESDSFVEKLNAEFPGFRSLDENNDPRWISFLGTSLGGVMEGTTYGDVAKDALGKLDYRKFASVVREFARQANIVFSPNGTPTDGAVTGQIRPKSVSVPPQASTQARPRIVSAAEIAAFRRAAFAHKAEERYGMTAQQVAEQLRFYEDAEAEGRVQ